MEPRFGRLGSVTALLLAAGAAPVQAQTTVVFRDGVSPTPAYSGTRDVQLLEASLAPDAKYDGARLTR